MKVCCWIDWPRHHVQLLLVSVSPDVFAQKGGRRCPRRVIVIGATLTEKAWDSSEVSWNDDNAEQSRGSRLGKGLFGLLTSVSYTSNHPVGLFFARE